MAVLTSPPQAIAPGQGDQIGPPNNTPWAHVVISNLSPYLLQVTVDANVYWLNPFTEDIYGSGTTHNPVNLTAQALAGATVPAGTSAQVQARWYGPDDQPEGNWPVSLTAQAVQAAISGLISAQDVYDVLFSGSFPVPAVSSSRSVTSLHNYAGVLVAIANPGGAGISFQITVTNNTSGSTFTCWAITPLTAIEPYLYYFPITANAGDVVQVTFTGTGSPTTLTVTIVGLGMIPPGAQIPGHPLAVYPLAGLGVAKALAVASGSSATLLVAPNSGQGYRLHDWCSDDAGAVTGMARLVIAGTDVISSQVGQGVAAHTLIPTTPLHGRTVYQGAVVVANALSGPADFYLHYDIITLPQVI